MYPGRMKSSSVAIAALMLGTTRLREPSGLTRSIAMPRFTASGITVAGLPLTWVNALFISGCEARARTSA